MQRLEEYVVKGGKRLRMGYTTGTCAAAASVAAATVLLGGEIPTTVLVQTPAGIPVEVDVEQCRKESGRVTCAVQKDAGDDPDITDGIMVFATVSRCEKGIHIDGGEGIGRATLPGLACPVGEAAINPAPRRQICQSLEGLLRKHGVSQGLHVLIWAPEGKALAQKTFNPRLGIEGGISVLGTSGIVEPMSEAALVSTIRAEIDARKAGGSGTLLLVPGNYGRDYAKDQWGISLDKGVKCSNFIGETLDYAVYKAFSSIVLLGHAGKLVKLAAGIMNTHSAVADGRAEVLACHGALCGLGQQQVKELFHCVTVEAADHLLTQWECGEMVWNSIGQRIQFQLEHRIGKKAEIAYGAFLSRGLVAKSPLLESLLSALREGEEG